ncbi:NLI interacting factor-like phosphatase family protein [Histomonas meleagridis]|uniref:NLI interacting factor-like phosphatase family protein n=1 Tax=Histomonas meleagridis TaxID=135588 RepID=UPI00355AA977|nr:NLI interacting factor-like phosphatase family protein [Histomonas meleagridis]KAH0804442.1 NLI interacting factor-like phosphatase family protein [Histomonas meleagridis]
MEEKHYEGCTDEKQDLQGNRPNLVLDLDETLVYITRLKTLFPSEPIYAGKQKFYLHKRPGLSEFLERASAIYNIIIFTAADKEYADSIIGKIAPFIPEGNRYYKKSIKNIKGFAVKDLNTLSLPIEKTILVDDSPSSGILQPLNQIIISPWHGEKEDNVINAQLLPLVTNIGKSDNIPKAIVENTNKNRYENLTIWPTLLKNKTSQTI